MKLKLFALFIFFFAFSAQSKEEKSPSAPPKNEIKSVRINHDLGTTRLVFEVDGEINYSVFSLDNPSRLIVDFNNIISKPKLELLSKKFGPIVKVRTSYNNSQRLRIVLDLKNKISYDEFTLQSAANTTSRLVIDINDQGSNNYNQTTSSPMNEEIIDEIAVSNDQNPKSFNNSAPPNQDSLRVSDKISITREQLQQKADESEVPAREKARINRELTIQAAKEQIAKIQAEREQAERDQAERDQPVRDQPVRDQAERDQAERKQAERDQAVRDQPVRDQPVRDQAERDQAAREQAAKKKLDQKQEAMPFQASKDWFLFDVGVGITSGSYCGTCFTYELGVGLRFTDYLSVRSTYLSSFSLDSSDTDSDITINETTWRLTSPTSGLFFEMGSGDYNNDQFSSTYDWSSNQYYFWDYDSEVDVIGIGRSTTANKITSGWKLKSYSPSNNADTIYYYSGFMGWHF